MASILLSTPDLCLVEASEVLIDRVLWLLTVLGAGVPAELILLVVLFALDVVEAVFGLDCGLIGLA